VEKRKGGRKIPKARRRKSVERGHKGRAVAKKHGAGRGKIGLLEGGGRLQKVSKGNWGGGDKLEKDRLIERPTAWPKE